MKTVLIVTSCFEIGGSRTSLQSLLSVLDTSKIKVDIFARECKGALKYKMPNCTVLPECIWLSHHIYDGNVLQKFICRCLYCIRIIFQILGIDLFRLYGYMGGRRIGSGNYDAVIGFDETMPRYISYLPAKKRISWIHCDYRRHTHSVNEQKFYERIDNIVCVSNFAKESFIDVLPKFASKVVVIENVINIDDIIIKSRERLVGIERFFSKKDDIFSIISIGRLDPVKQFEKIPSIAAEVKNLLNGSHKFQWLILGGGNDVVMNNIHSEIKKYNLENEVKTLGMQSNPFPFLAHSHLYVCTSLSETFSYTIHEGLALRVPFICNNFPGASESVSVGKEGFVLPIEEMPKRIVELIIHPLRIKECSICNDKLLQNFYDLI
ncbi:MAG: glycosyltransferase [Bacteroidales bacterium]|nr:glycosyltransferase [Bacteroidales bacterium]